jgi:hypothetical protein
MRCHIGSSRQRAVPERVIGGRGRVFHVIFVTMPTPETLNAFIARVEENAHAEACEQFYTPDASIQENTQLPRIGRDFHVANERRVMARARTVHSHCVRPVFVNGNHAVIRWVFRFEWLDGTVTEMEELAYQRWEGERIAQEQFFYDPAQRVPKRPVSP